MGAKVVKQKDLIKNQRIPHIKTIKIIDLTDGTSSSFTKIISDMNKSSSFLKNVSANNHSSFLKAEVENSKDPFHILKTKAKRLPIAC